MANLSCAHTFFSGRVQGVYFRYNTKKIARAHGIVGWVRNLPDGRVEALLEGEKETIEKVVAELHGGPGASHVDELKLVWLDPSGLHSCFEVKY